MTPELRNKIDDPRLKREKKEREKRLLKEQEVLQQEVNILQRKSLELHQVLIRCRVVVLFVRDSLLVFFLPKSVPR